MKLMMKPEATVLGSIIIGGIIALPFLVILPGKSNLKTAPWPTPEYEMGVNCGLMGFLMLDLEARLQGTNYTGEQRVRIVCERLGVRPICLQAVTNLAVPSAGADRGPAERQDQGANQERKK